MYEQRRHKRRALSALLILLVVTMAATVLPSLPRAEAQSEPDTTLADEIGVWVRVSCLGGNGRIDTDVMNRTSASAEYAIKVSGLSRQVHTVASLDWWRAPRTGRPDGQYRVVVERNGVVIHEESVNVTCDAETPEPTARPVTVIPACKNGRGYVLFAIVNQTAASQSYVVEFENIRNISGTAEPYGQVTKARSGRRDGTYDIAVRVGSTYIFRDQVTVDCTWPLDGPTPVPPTPVPPAPSALEFITWSVDCTDQGYAAIASVRNPTASLLEYTISVTGEPTFPVGVLPGLGAFPLVRGVGSYFATAHVGNLNYSYEWDVNGTECDGPAPSALEFVTWSVDCTDQGYAAIASVRNPTASLLEYTISVTGEPTFPVGVLPGLGAFPLVRGVGSYFATAHVGNLNYSYEWNVNGTECDGPPVPTPVPPPPPGEAPSDEDFVNDVWQQVVCQDGQGLLLVTVTNAHPTREWSLSLRLTDPQKQAAAHESLTRFVRLGETIVIDVPNLANGTKWNADLRKHSSQLGPASNVPIETRLIDVDCPFNAPPVVIPPEPIGSGSVTPVQAPPVLIEALPDIDCTGLKVVAGYNGTGSAWWDPVTSSGVTVEYDLQVFQYGSGLAHFNATEPFWEMDVGTLTTGATNVVRVIPYVAGTSQFGQPCEAVFDYEQPDFSAVPIAFPLDPPSSCAGGAVNLDPSIPYQGPTDACTISTSMWDEVRRIAAGAAPRSGGLCLGAGGAFIVGVEDSACLMFDFVTQDWYISLSAGVVVGVAEFGAGPSVVASSGSAPDSSIGEPGHYLATSFGLGLGFVAGISLEVALDRDGVPQLDEWAVGVSIEAGASTPTPTISTGVGISAQMWDRPFDVLGIEPPMIDLACIIDPDCAA